jgi:protein ImuA
LQRELIAELREQIRHIERRPAHRTAFEATGLAEVDALLPGGGFPRGSLTEIAGAPGSGKTALCLAAMARITREEGLAAFVDGRGELYPPAAEVMGIDLARLLIVRPPPMRRTVTGEREVRGIGREPVLAALWSAEALLASGAFEVVGMDVPALPRRPGSANPEAMARRLASAAERGGAVGLWLTVPGELRVPAAVRLEVAAGPGGPSVRRVFARGLEGSQPQEVRDGTGIGA